MKFKHAQVLMLILLTVVYGCKQNRLKVNIATINENIEVVRFDDQLFSLPLKDTLSELLNAREHNPEFFDLFTHKIIRIGGIDDPEFPFLCATFLTDSLVLELKKEADNVFSDFEKTENELNKAFKHYKYHFPENEMPAIYVYISGLNQSVVTAQNLVGISLDKYLGTDFTLYKQLSTTPLYKIQNMHKHKLASDVVYAFAAMEFEKSKETTNLLSNMIYQGKLMYFVDALLPDLHDSLKIGYSAKQLEWCLNNEQQMWTYLVEQKMLYSNNRMDIVRYINDGPYTSSFPLDSPARTGVWIGWQIVRQFMNKHPEISVQELMKNNDYQAILNASAYFPEK